MDFSEDTQTASLHLAGPAEGGLNGLPNELKRCIFSFLGPHYYRYVAGTCRDFRAIYSNMHGNTTSIWETTVSFPRAELLLEDERAKERKSTLMRRFNLAYWIFVDSRQTKEGKWTFRRALIQRRFRFAHQFLLCSAMCGRISIKMFKLAEEKNFCWYSPTHLYDAAYYGQVHLLKWMKRKGRLSNSSHDCHCCLAGALKGSNSAAVLHWMKGQNLLEITPGVWYYSGLHGFVHVLDWLHDNGYEVDSDSLFRGGAESGRIEVLQWALDHHIVTQSCDPCTGAACFGHLGILKWLRANNFPWDGNVFNTEYKAVMEWALVNGCPTKKSERALTWDNYQ